MENHENTIYLYPGFRGDGENGGHVFYDLTTFDPCCGNFDAFYPFALDAIAALLEGCTPLCHCWYPLKREAKRRWLRPDREAVFGPSDEAEAIVRTIEEQGLDWTYCDVFEEARRGWFRIKRQPSKTFFVTADKADRRFLKANMYREGWVYVSGYLPGGCVDVGDLRSMAADFLRPDEWTPRHTAAAVKLEGDHARLVIEIDPYRYPVQQLIDRIQAVVARHGKTLEVCL